MDLEFSPSVYEHAAALIGESPWRVSRDPELLFRGHTKAFHLYSHAPVVVGIDIYNLEAEAYGATIPQPRSNGIPAISSHFCETTEDILQLDPLNPLEGGRIPMILEVGQRLADTLPGAEIRIPVSGPFSLASNLVGFNSLLCDVMEDPDGVRQALEHLALGQMAFCREIIAHGLGIAFFESGATPPLISPALFAEIELPVLKQMIRDISAAAGCPVPCIIGGNTFPVLDLLLETGTGYVICPSETDQGAFMRHMEAHRDVKVRVNTNPAVFTGTDVDVLRTELNRVLLLAEGRERVCIGTGALPFDANPDLVLAARGMLQEAGGRPLSRTGSAFGKETGAITL